MSPPHPPRGPKCVGIEELDGIEDARPRGLRIDGLQASRGHGTVLHGVSLGIEPGEILCLLGRNGCGRSTLLKAVMGLVPATGSVQWNGRQLMGRRPFEVARAGVGYVPEGREVFSALTVQQNLLLGRQERGGASMRRWLPSRSPQAAAHGAPSWSADELYAMFPSLGERRGQAAGTLSGGEQQMLALCRTLMGGPGLLLVDEPTEGLAPSMVAAVAACLLEARRRGVAVLLVEQKLSIALEVSQRCVVMGHGRLVFEGSPAALRADEAVRKEWLAV